MNLNKAILIGRLTRDPELKALPSGQQVCSFGLATNRVFVDKSGQKQEQVEFNNIVLFGRLADSLFLFNAHPVQRFMANAPGSL